MAFTILALLVALGGVVPRLTQDTLDSAGVAKVSDCDRLAAHPSDTQRTAPGVSQSDVDIPRARQACQRALAENPGDGRMLYQLGRTYFYDKDYERGIAYFRQSDAAGYAQGQFVLGLILIQGNGTEPDTCAGGELWVKAARQRHLYSKIYLTNNWLDGMFGECNLGVTEQEIDGMISAAEELAETETQRDDLAMLKKNWSARPR
jgi:TPR repeat protein